MTPATTEEIHRLLITTITMVDPKLTNDQKLDWIRIATDDVKDMPANLLAEACKVARSTCSFPGQIMPAILKHLASVMPAIERAAKERRQEQLQDRRGNVTSIGTIAKQLTHNRGDDDER